MYHILFCNFQVGSFNYDNTKMRYSTYFLPKLPNSTDPILDYDVSILNNLTNNERYVKGFENVDNLVASK